MRLLAQPVHHAPLGQPSLVEPTPMVELARAEAASLADASRQADARHRDAVQAKLEDINADDPFASLVDIKLSLGRRPRHDDAS